MTTLQTGDLSNSVTQRELNLIADTESLRNEFILINIQDGTSDTKIARVARTILEKTIKFKTPSKARSPKASRVAETMAVLQGTTGNDDTKNLENFYIETIL